MSMRILPSQIAPSANFILRRFWAGIFGNAIEQNRQARGLSIEQAAQLAGMEISEWAAIEAGAVPQTEAELRTIAGTLEIGYDRILTWSCSAGMPGRDEACPAAGLWRQVLKTV